MEVDITEFRVYMNPSVVKIDLPLSNLIPYNKIIINNTSIETSVVAHLY